MSISPWLPAPMFNNNCSWIASQSNSRPLTRQSEPVSSCYDLNKQLVTNGWTRALMRFFSFPCKRLTLGLLTSSSSLHTRGSMVSHWGQQGDVSQVWQASWPSDLPARLPASPALGAGPQTCLVSRMAVSKCSGCRSLGWLKCRCQLQKLRSVSPPLSDTSGPCFSSSTISTLTTIRLMALPMLGCL